MRNITKPPSKRITQGSIFFGAKSPYNGLGCHGIGITARCDTARDFKASTFTFLPIVSVEDWMWHEAKLKAINDQKKTVAGQLRSLLIQTEGTDIILTAFGEEAAFFNISKTQPKALKNISGQHQDVQKAESLEKIDWDKLPVTLKKRISQEFRQLVSGALQEYFFLDNIETSTLDKTTNMGYVALLRDVSSVSREVALNLISGIDHDKYEALLKEDMAVANLYVGKEDFALILSELTSPYIEKMMQSFSMLFSRIGTQDVHESCVNKISNFLKV